MRLLIIEDERKIARIIAEALRREHHAVDVTHDGDEGLNMAMSEPYDLLVVDRMLPGLSGTDIVQNLRGGRLRTRRSAWTAALMIISSNPSPSPNSPPACERSLGAHQFSNRTRSRSPIS